MKRFFCVLIAMAMFMMALPARATDVIISGLSNVGELPELKYEYDISFKENNKSVLITEEAIDENELNYLLEIFSDDNLTCVNSDITEFIEPSSDDITFMFYDEDTVDYGFYVNKDRVLVTIANGHEMTMKQGIFKFKNADTYNELLDFVAENRIQQEEKDEQQEIEGMKNAVSITNFKTIYHASFPLARFGDPFEWGICSYVREGESKATVTAYHAYFYSDDLKILYLSDSEVLDNKFKSGTKRAVKIKNNASNGTEYDNTLTGELYSYEVQVNVAKDMRAENIKVDYTHLTSNKKFTFYPHMDKCEQTGKLPSDVFSEKNNIIYKNKVENFTKLYTESISAENLYLKNSEWGICKYSNDISGEVYAFYFYSAYDDEYLISEIKDKILITPKGDISTNFQNKIDFGTGRALQGGYEVFDYDFVYPFTFRFGINADKDIIYRGIFYNDSGRNCVINKYKYLSGNLDSLNFDLQETVKPVESAVPEDVKQAEDESEKKDELQEKQKDYKESEQEKNEDEKIESDEILEETKEEPIKENKADSTKSDEEISLDYNFIDVPKNHWAYNNIYEFATKGIVLGYGNGYFGVNDPITYEHFSLLLDRLFNYKADNKERVPSIREDVIVSVVKALNIDVSDTKTAIINQKFSDCKNLKADSPKYIAAAIECGLVIGADGELFPDENLTRAETVTLLKRAVEYKAK